MGRGEETVLFRCHLGHTGHGRRTKRTAGQHFLSALAPNLDQIWDRFGENICPPQTIVHMRATVGGLFCPFGQIRMRRPVGDALIFRSYFFFTKCVRLEALEFSQALVERVHETHYSTVTIIMSIVRFNYASRPTKSTHST